MMKEMVRNVLDEMIGERVRVHIRINETEDQFGTQLSVVGTLEGDAEAGRFRVLSVDDPSYRRSCYAYFMLDDVTCLADRRSTDKKTFDDGAVVVVFIGGKPTHPYIDMTTSSSGMELAVIASSNGRPGILIP